MVARSILCALGLAPAALTLCIATAATAQPVEVTINTEITSMALSGTGAMPLGTDLANPPANEGFQFVQSTVTATTSSNPSAQSAGTTSLTIDLNLDMLNPFNSTISVGTVSTFNFFLDLTFTDVDPVNDYAAGLGSTFTLLADPTKPLAITLTDSVTFTLADIIANPGVFPDNPGINATSTAVKHGLGVDVNNNSIGPDVLRYTAENFDLGDDLTFSDDVFTGTTLDDILDAIVTGSGVPLTFDAQVSIASGSFVFTGTVADPATDPPFSIQLIGVASAAPEPGTLILLALGLGWLGVVRARSRTRATARSA
jgi:hypothetical protein